MYVHSSFFPFSFVLQASSEASPGAGRQWQSWRGRLGPVLDDLLENCDAFNSSFLLMLHTNILEDEVPTLPFVSLCHCVPMSLCHCVTVSLCHCVTVLPVLPASPCHCVPRVPVPPVSLRHYHCVTVRVQGCSSCYGRMQKASSLRTNSTSNACTTPGRLRPQQVPAAGTVGLFARLAAGGPWCTRWHRTYLTSCELSFSFVNRGRVHQCPIPLLVRSL